MAAEEEPQAERTDNDGTWKDLIEHLWPLFIHRTLPALYEKLDLTRQPEFLMQELRDPLPEAMKHNSAFFVDELMKLYLKDGSVLWVYLHIEVQGPGGEDISYRMYSYCCLIVVHYHEMPVALAILTSPRPIAEQKRDSLGAYEVERFGTQLKYQYNCIELYKLDDDELLSSEDPIDLAFYAAKKAAKCQDKERQKLAYLRKLTRVLAEKEWNDKERREIFTFIARIINLKEPELRTEYLSEVKAMKEETHMESFVEKYFREEGFSAGRKEGHKEAWDVMESFMEESGLSHEMVSKFRTQFLSTSWA